MDFGNSFGLVESYLPLHIVLIRLLIAAVLGGVIGIEREVHTAEAGLRTHILVAVAAALFTILTFEIFHTISENGEMPRADPIRAIEAVTAGIAFLGAGAIFRRGAGVQGLTTGAGMWLAGAVGVACALGYYLISLVVSMFAIVVLAALRALAHGVIRREGKDSEQAEGDGNASKIESPAKGRGRRPVGQAR
ncbi:MgtC/SapB family protein [Devosia rhodophyticola]|uniref:Protein MgtC n=1 Tax=Devosia rhodophyticola TaxID=3026423 RepID=A0ABY7YV30_9HYPH|nr:MgtC/SapB family protein [Devosia rhodophyticola]WDR05047.1 MgtC/SapB family protein [Devosia rhodophyticola]